jgi:hypothetical protein
MELNPDFLIFISDIFDILEKATFGQISSLSSRFRKLISFGKNTLLKRVSQFIDDIINQS